MYARTSSPWKETGSPSEEKARTLPSRLHRAASKASDFRRLILTCIKNVIIASWAAAETIRHACIGASRVPNARGALIIPKSGVQFWRDALHKRPLACGPSERSSGIPGSATHSVARPRYLTCRVWRETSVDRPSLWIPADHAEKSDLVQLGILM